MENDYVDILKDNAEKSAPSLTTFYQQDNDLKHTFTAVHNFVKDTQIRVLKGPFSKPKPHSASELDQDDPSGNENSTVSRESEMLHY